MNPWKQARIDNNAASRDLWSAYTGHRDHVTRLLLEGAPPGTGRLCVLGAGNCNDLNLDPLVRHYREVHLVDLDAQALARGVARQGMADQPAVRRHGDVDVTGALDLMAAWSAGSPVQDAEVAACADALVVQAAKALPGPFDVVASTCLLSQLIWTVVEAVTERHPRFVELVQAVRAGHFRLLLRLAAPGGLAILITDVVASDSFPALGTVPDAALANVLVQLARQHNHFHGVNPLVLTSLPAKDPVLAPSVAGTEILPPWRWQLAARTYAVWAVRMRKRADGPAENAPRA